MSNLGRDGKAGMAESCSSSSETSVLISGGLASLFGIDIPEEGFKFFRCCLPLNDKSEFKNISSSTVSASRAAHLAKIVFPAAENITLKELMLLEYRATSWLFGSAWDNLHNFASSNPWDGKY